ncbi:hypothetical protein [Methylobacterium komagatae]
MPTNLLSLPLLAVAVETATNESWRDAVAFAVAGTVTYTPTIGNTGNGTITYLTVTAGSPIGDYTLTLTGTMQYRFTDPDGYVIGAGVIGQPFSASGVSLALNAGTVPFVSGDSFTITVLPEPIDITGIRFVMQMRAANVSAQGLSTNTSASPQVLVQGDTDDGTMINGGSGGVLGLAIPHDVMANVPLTMTDAPHLFDIVGIADGDQRRCVTGTCAIVSGYTFPAA